MSASFWDLREALLREVLVRVPSTCHPKLEAVSRHMLSEIRSAKFKTKRIEAGWGPELAVFQIRSDGIWSREVVRWAISFPDISLSDNRMPFEFFAPPVDPNPWRLSDLVDHVFRIAQLRFGGPQKPTGHISEVVLKANPCLKKFLGPLKALLDIDAGCDVLNDVWWIVVRSILDGTFLPMGVDVLSIIHVTLFKHEGPLIEIASLFRAGLEYGFLTTDVQFVDGTRGGNVQAYLDISADCGKSMLIQTCRELDALRAKCYDLGQNSGSGVVGSMSFDQSVSSGHVAYDLTENGKRSHVIQGWPFRGTLVINEVDALHDGPGVQFPRGTPGVDIVATPPLCDKRVSYDTTNNSLANLAVEEDTKVLEENIEHYQEVAVSADEAFARTVEREVLAEQLCIPAAKISPDWAAPVNPLAGLRESLDASMDDDAIEHLHLLEFSRTPKSFHDALETSDILRACHVHMEQLGLSCRLGSGARLYVQTADQHADALRAVADLDLQSRHIIASAMFVDAVSEAIKTIRGKERVQEKKRPTEVPRGLP